MAKGDPLQHVYLTAHGDYNSGPWVGEAAQIGVRLAFVPKVGAPDMGATFTMATGTSVVETFATVAGTNGTLTQKWRADGGSASVGLQVNDLEQINMAENFLTFLNAIKSSQATTFWWRYIKIAPVTADGKYGADSSIYTHTTGISGTGTATTHEPPEVAVAASIMAPVLGRRGRGRMYIPAIAGSARGSDGVVASGYQTSLNTAMKTLIDDLQTAHDTVNLYMPLVVVTSAGKPTAVRPNQVRVGNHFDVQKRRQDQVKEAYASLAL